MPEPKTTANLIDATDRYALARALVALMGPGPQVSMQISGIECVDEWGLSYGPCTVEVRKDRADGK